MNPQELLYAETHEWVAVAEEGGAKVATVGISDFAVEALTDLVYIQFSKSGGDSVSAGDAFGEVESVKAVSDLYSPVTGEVVAVHDKLADKLETLGDDPFGEGWMLKVKIADESSLGKLMDYDAYKKMCAEQ
ncbi:MAG: glycine cleavage system protein GcvH [Pirellulales bacterium]|nr:glycine cleavage system protein GcvH [Pirellulales bacterium]